MVQKKRDAVQRVLSSKIIFGGVLLLLVLLIFGVILQMYMFSQQGSSFSQAPETERSSYSSSDQAVGTVSLTIVPAPEDSEE